VFFTSSHTNPLCFSGKSGKGVVKKIALVCVDIPDEWKGIAQVDTLGGKQERY